MHRYLFGKRVIPEGVVKSVLKLLGGLVGGYDKLKAFEVAKGETASSTIISH